jgi:hypothetical protein
VAMNTPPKPRKDMTKKGREETRRARFLLARPK